MPYKLVALDLDGTLLNSEGKLSDKHIEVVKKAEDDGLIVVIATGRYYMQMITIIEQLNFKGVLVSNDGAVIINSKTKDILFEHSFTINEITPLLQYCDKHHIHYAVTTAFNHYVNFMSPYQINKCRQYDINYTEGINVFELNETIMKLTIDDEQRINGWQNMNLSPQLKLRANAQFFKEYVHFESSKANGLRKVLELLHINANEMIAIGDYYNDVDMLELAGLGIAMGNAPEDIKDIANDVTLSNDEDGVYVALAKHLKWF